MREFHAAVPGRLRAVSVGSKILYTAFAIAALCGLWVSWRLYGAAVGEQGPAVYYAGAAATAKPSAPPPASDGPAIELAPEDARPKPMADTMSERKLLEVTHFHLFTVPVLVLILAHLWLLTKVPPWLQNGGVAAAVVSSGLHLASPWIVRGRPALAFLMPTAAVAMLVTLAVLAVVSVIDMWLPNPKPQAPADMLAELRKKQAAARGSPG